VGEKKTQTKIAVEIFYLVKSFWNEQLLPVLLCLHKLSQP